MASHSPKGTASERSTSTAGAVYVVTSLLQRSAAFITLPLVATIVGPSGFGKISLATTIALVSTYAMPLGQDVLIARTLTAGLGQQEELRQVVQSLRVLASGAVVALLITAALAVLLQDLRLLIALDLGSAVVIAASTTAPLAVWRARRETWKIVRLLLSITFAQAFSRVALSAMADGAVWGWAVGSTVGAIVAVVATWKWIRTQTRASSQQRYNAWPSARAGLAFLPHQMAAWGLAGSDRLVLAVLVSSASLGIYSLTYQICAVLGTVLGEFNRAIMPSYGLGAPVAQVVGIAVRQAWLTVAVGGIAICVVPVALKLILPPEYESGIVLGQPLVLGMIFLGLYLAFANVITLRQVRPALISLATMLAVAVNVTCNITFVPQFGLMAAAWATAAAYGALVLAAALLTRGPFRRALLPPILLSTFVLSASGTLHGAWAGAWTAAGATVAITGLTAVALDWRKTAASERSSFDRSITP